MNKDQPVSKDYFLKRLADLCLRSGLEGFPKDSVDQNILLKSMALTLGKAESYNQKEVDEKLKYWMSQISQIKKLDHSSLRRWLVDGGYLTRNPDGSCYQIVPFGPRPGFFDAAVEEIDVEAAIYAAREEIARRKREYLEKSKRGG